MEKIRVEGTLAEQPVALSIKAQLGWDYYFSQEGWVCFYLTDGTWLVCNEDHDLDSAETFTNDESFIDFLEEIVDNRLEEDEAVEFFSQFVAVPELVSEEVASTMKKVIGG